MKLKWSRTKNEKYWSNNMSNLSKNLKSYLLSRTKLKLPLPIANQGILCKWENHQHLLWKISLSFIHTNQVPKQEKTPIKDVMKNIKNQQSVQCKSLKYKFQDSKACHLWDPALQAVNNLQQALNKVISLENRISLYRMVRNNLAGMAQIIWCKVIKWCQSKSISIKTKICLSLIQQELAHLLVIGRDWVRILLINRKIQQCLTIKLELHNKN